MKRIVTLPFVILSIYCHSQNATTVPEKPFIEVIGTASKEVIPDRIFISIVLSDKVVNNKTYTILSQEESLKNALSRININLNNLFLTNSSSELSMYKMKETGFRVSKEYTLIVKNVTELTNVFSELYAINIREASISKKEYSRIDSLRKEVRMTAIKAAKDKAQYLVAAIGESIDKPLEIREQNEIPFFQDNLSSNTTNSIHSGGEVSESATPVFMGIVVKFSYLVRYSLKQ